MLIKKKNSFVLYRGSFFYDIDTSWRDDKQRQLRDHGREQEQQQDEEYGDDSSSAAAAEQQRIQAQEMAAYHKRLASLSLPEAQRLTQIDLKHSDSHVTAQVGHPAYLKCAVSNQGDQLVSRVSPVLGTNDEQASNLSCIST